MAIYTLLIRGIFIARVMMTNHIRKFLILKLSLNLVSSPKALIQWCQCSSGHGDHHNQFQK